MSKTRKGVTWVIDTSEEDSSSSDMVAASHAIVPSAPATGPAVPNSLQFQIDMITAELADPTSPDPRNAEQLMRLLLRDGRAEEALKVFEAGRLVGGPIAPLAMYAHVLCALQLAKQTPARKRDATAEATLLSLVERIASHYSI